MNAFILGKFLVRPAVESEISLNALRELSFSDEIRQLILGLLA
jgi:hypothetical protein